MLRTGIRLRVARKTRPVRYPSIYVFPDIKVTWDTPAQIDFHSIETPLQIAEAPLPTPPTLPVSFSPLEIPTLHSESLLGLLDGSNFSTEMAAPVLEDLPPMDFEKPGIEILFSPIKSPMLEGRDYSVGTRTEQRNLRTSTTWETRSPPTKCRHGLMFCGLCARVDRRQRPRRRQVVDVFGELWFVLQPPVLERIDQAGVFPGDRKPYPFQVAGIKWLVDTPRALLADEMGLGKTIQAIVAMRVLFRMGELHKVLVVCPVSVAATWMKELTDWSPDLRAIRVNETADYRDTQWGTPAQVYVVSYDTLRSDISSKRVDPHTFELCIIDEAQYIKNPGAQRSRAVKQITAKYRWALTGTPLENSLEDTLSIFDFLIPKFGDRVFGSQYYISAARFKTGISPYTLRRTVDEVALDLPDLTHQEHWLELSPKQRSAYETAELYGVSDIRKLGQSATRVHIFALINELKQICNRDAATGASTRSSQELMG